MKERLRWYKNRLAAMSTAEIMHRVDEAARKRADAITALPAAATPRDYGELPEIPGLIDGIDAWNVPPGLMAEWSDDARRAQSGEHQIFGQTWPPLTSYGGCSQIWHINPASVTLWPRDVFCFNIDYRHGQKNGDIKLVWELNRLQYLQPIAALARKRQDKELAQFCLGEIESWIDNNPPFFGINWNSGIELALRLVSFLTVTTLVGKHLTREARNKIWASLQTHARWIARYPSRYSSGNNHRAAEGLGLFMIGCLCPHFPEAAEWQETGWGILCDTAQRQILPDGAGAEQAVAYSASVLETLLTGLQIAHATNMDVPTFYVRKLTLGGEYLRWLFDSANGMPHIGDDDNACVFGAYHSGDAYGASIVGCIAAVTGRADLTPPRPQPHLRQAIFGFAPLPDFAPYGTRCFAHGGMVIGRHKNAQGDILLAFDHGYLGYLSIAAHGHADTLALWLHIGDQPVFVDAGTYLYHAHGDERRYFRGSMAHNGLTINGTDSSTMAGAFNWSHKARATLRSYESRGDFWEAEAEHDGYLENFHVLHRRGLHVSPANGAVIEDGLVGTDTQQVEIGFLLHPALTARREGSEILILKGEQLILRVRHEGGLETTIGSGWYAPEFGIKQTTTRLIFSGTLAPQQKAVTHLYWAF
jgi:uncharacterized heparinase superfamily protein